MFYLINIKEDATGKKNEKKKLRNLKKTSQRN